MAWVGCEYIRSNLFTGFAWHGLGVSQFKNLIIVQIASWGGVYAVSWLIMLVNTALALTIGEYIEHKGRRPKRPHVELMVGLTSLAVVFSHGWRSLPPPGNVQGTELRLAAIQPAIPQNIKWDSSLVVRIYAALNNLSETALHIPDLDMVVWPETALPDDVISSPPSYDLVYRLVTNGVPFLVGSMDTQWFDDRKPQYYNSSFLFDEYGAPTQGYDKRHLVVFGEYIPFRERLPFFQAMTPIQESFSPGSTSTVFKLESPPVPFSVLICFEDTVAQLARESVQNGARLIVNQTNDGWFDPSSASRQHMAHCVFRCLENRVPAVRVGNSGVTCHIDRYGRVDYFSDDKGNIIYGEGFDTFTVKVPIQEYTETTYTRVGDRFARAGLGMLIAMFVSVGVLRFRMGKNG
jgi:apolipoprotein N-acyltransferase